MLKLELAEHPYLRTWEGNGSIARPRPFADLSRAIIEVSTNKWVSPTNRRKAGPALSADHLNFYLPLPAGTGDYSPAMEGGEVVRLVVKQHMSPINFLAATIGDPQRYRARVYAALYKEAGVVFSPIQVCDILADESWREFLDPHYGNAFPVVFSDGEVRMLHAKYQPGFDGWLYRVSSLGLGGGMVNPGLQVFHRQAFALTLPRV